MSKIDSTSYNRSNSNHNCTRELKRKHSLAPNQHTNNCPKKPNQESLPPESHCQLCSQTFCLHERKLQTGLGTGYSQQNYGSEVATTVEASYSLLGPAAGMEVNNNNKRVHKLVLTGGPCSGKTTGQARLSTFFENMGWKVFRVPETATHLLSGGVEFGEMNEDQVEEFQEDLLLCMIQTEETFFRLAKRSEQNCLVICDRGTMDARAYMSEESWDRVLKRNALNAVELRDNRYDQVVHLVTAANGAEDFYNTEDNPMRKEGLELARMRDQATGEAWIGHPYLEIIDNSTDFDTKLKRLIMAVCLKVDIDVGDRLAQKSKKVKFLVAKIPSDVMFPSYQDFHVVHEYLISANPKIQLRLRMRGQGYAYSYQYTVRQVRANNQVVELRRQISHRDYLNLLAQRDDSHYTVQKKRRCFLWQNLYFQLDMYLPPCSPRCEGLILLETYTTLKSSDVKLPPFLEIIKDVTGDLEYSMYNLSKTHPGLTKADS